MPKLFQEEPLSEEQLHYAKVSVERNKAERVSEESKFLEELRQRRTYNKNYFERIRSALN
jgi:hypothetical protein